MRDGDQKPKRSNLTSIRCCLPHCRKSKRDNINYRFFKFPEYDCPLFRQWVESCSLSEEFIANTSSLVLCQDHFAKAVIGKKFLNRGALPELYLSTKFQGSDSDSTGNQDVDLRAPKSPARKRKGSESPTDICQQNHKMSLVEVNHKSLHIAHLPHLKIRETQPINDPVMQNQQQENGQHQHNNGSITKINELEESANRIKQEVYITQEIIIKSEPQEEEVPDIGQLPPQAIGKINTLSSLPPQISSYNGKLTTDGQTNPAVNKSNICAVGNSNIPTTSRDSSWQVSSFKDALRFLKPIEEYAMVAENYRVIGLISQLEEVLKQESKKSSTED